MVIADVLHIRPWEQRDLLTVAELRAAFAYIDDMNAQAERG